MSISIISFIGIFCLLFFVKCNKAATLNAHVIAHTHDDVGWLKTVDEYYYGANNTIQYAGVQYILDTVIPALQANPSRRFIYVEIAYFWRWWNEQTEQMKQVVRDLVAERRLEFCNGGWVMNDEADTFYPAVIDQMTEGHRFLFDEFGVRPTIGWHIDPFGHSATQASLFAMMGFDAFFFARIDYQDHALRNKTKRMELVWRGSKSLGEKTQIFTHVLYDGYCPPTGFNFQSGNTEPVRFDPKLFSYNIKQKAELFVKTVKKRSLAYRTSEVMIPLGCDFEYMNAIINFKNMDYIIDYVNSHPEYGVKTFYSTPSIYTEAVHKYSKDNDLSWEVKTDDFFPYADRPYAYWTGFYTSRPALKGYVRTRSALLHAVEKLTSTAVGSLPSVVTPDVLDKIGVLSRAMGTAQHHDAVSGTEKQHVADDYAKRLSMGTVSTQQVISEIMGKLMTKDKSSSPPKFAFCQYINMSICEPLRILSKGKVVPFMAYNPLGWERTEYIKLPIPVKSVQVVDEVGSTLDSQVHPNSDLPGTYTLYFAITLPPTGYKSFVVQPSFNSVPLAKQINETQANDLIMENEYLKVVFSTSTGRMVSITNKQLDKMIDVQQNILWYNASAGNNVNSSQASGAYIFRPNRTAPFDFTSGNKPAISMFTGPVVQEIRQSWSPWAYQAVRLYAGEHHVETEATIGPISIKDHFGKEVITKYTTSLNTNQLWYTDAQGQEMQQREYNYRPTWTLNVTNPVAGNYYPMNSAAFIKDETNDIQFTLLSDRSQGCSSLSNGELEAMMHRRLLYDDDRGVGEALNETDAIRNTHWIVVDKPKLSARQQRPLTLRLNQPIQLAFAEAFSGNTKDWFSEYHTSFSPLSKALPPNVHLLNMRTLNTGITLLRLNHIYAVGEDSIYSKPVTIDLDALFKNLQVIEISEYSLSGNQPLDNVHRLKWKTDTKSKVEQEGSIDEGKWVKVGDSSNTQVTLSPMDIKTFMIRFTPM